MHSDIDLYVVGFKGNYWKAYSEAVDLAGDIEINIACEEDCFPILKNQVLQKGIPLWTRASF